MKTPIESVLEWLNARLTEEKGYAKTREHMAQTWRGGTDANWKAAGSDKTKAEREIEAKSHDRISLRHKHNARMLRAAIKELTAKLTTP